MCKLRGYTPNMRSYEDIPTYFVGESDSDSEQSEVDDSNARYNTPIHN